MKTLALLIPNERSRAILALACAVVGVLIGLFLPTWLLLLLCIGAVVAAHHLMNNDRSARLDSILRSMVCLYAVTYGLLGLWLAHTLI